MSAIYIRQFYSSIFCSALYKRGVLTSLRRFYLIWPHLDDFEGQEYKISIWVNTWQIDMIIKLLKCISLIYHTKGDLYVITSKISIK